MPAAARYGSVRRFGPRYGRKTREKLGKIEEERRLKNRCPYCHKPRVKKLAAGIWQCSACSSKFAGKAYTVGKRTISAEELVEKASEAGEAK